MSTKQRQEQSLMAQQSLVEQAKRMADFMFWQTFFQMVVGVALLIGLGATLYYVRQIGRSNKFNEHNQPKEHQTGAISRANPPQTLTSINEATSNFDWRMAVGGLRTGLHGVRVSRFAINSKTGAMRANATSLVQGAPARFTASCNSS
jgi:hypothetical protein